MTFTDIAVIVVMIYIMCWCVQKIIETILDNYFYERYIDPYLDEEGQEGTKMDAQDTQETIMFDPESLKPIIKEIMEEMESGKNEKDRFDRGRGL